VELYNFYCLHFGQETDIRHVFNMAWKTLSLHFRQTYQGGYRYLDRCGEFMLAAEEKMDFIAGEAKPIGAKMEIPEQGLNLTCDANFLTLTQELPTVDNNFFVNVCKGSAQLALEYFKPKSILKNGFAIKEYWPFSTVQELLAASLKLGEGYQNEIGKVVGMVPEQKKLDFTFVSGSKEFHLVVQPVTFDHNRLTKQNAGSQINRVEKNRIDRRNKFADRINQDFVVSHALILELDLMENDPPADVSLEKHFEELKQKNDQLKKLLVGI
jgi:hypothetical protein